MHRRFPLGNQLGCNQPVMPDFISSVLIKTVAFPRRLGIFRSGSGNFNQAPEAAEKRGILGIQVEQHLIVWKTGGLMAEYDRCHVGQLIVSAAVRNEIRWGKSPQKIVELLDH